MSHLSVLTMRRHVRDLCYEAEIGFEWDHRNKAWAAPELRLIHIPPVKSPIIYAVALHEIGHVLGRHQDSVNVTVRERCEQPIQ
jgi:hypothetical protein